MQLCEIIQFCYLFFIIHLYKNKHDASIAHKINCQTANTFFQQNKTLNISIMIILVLFKQQHEQCKESGTSGKESVMLSLRNCDRFHKESTHSVT